MSPAHDRQIGSTQGAAMQLVKFEQIDEQGKRERDIYINPEQVRSIVALPDYGKNKRTRIAFSADDNVLVRGTADEIWAMLEGRSAPPPAEPTLPRED
jgi:hypothetical protein